MTRVRMIPYKMGSKSSKDLAAALGIKRLLPVGRSRFRPRSSDILINWGSGEDRGFTQGTILNPHDAVNRASDKVQCLRVLTQEGVPCVEYATGYSTAARQWLEEGEVVFARTLTRANSGRGIVIMENPEDFIQAPLYTKAEHKDFECRVHVMLNRPGSGGTPNGEAFDFQQKRRRNSPEGEEPLNHSPYIWNHDNHYVFCRNGLSMNESQIEECKEVAVLATQVLGLDFAAIDIGWNETRGAFIFEVNTAPGLTGTTLENYTRKFREYLHNG